MRLSSTIALRPFFAFLPLFATLQGASARERGPRVEVVCPSPPVAVKLAERKALVYELHITNFDMSPLTLKRVEVFADEDWSRPLKIISDDALSAVMIEAGSTGGGKDSRVIGPAKRAVVFLWIELELDARLPW
jgi:hypothetical protein